MAVRARFPVASVLVVVVISLVFTASFIVYGLVVSPLSTGSGTYSKRLGHILRTEREHRRCRLGDVTKLGDSCSSAADCYKNANDVRNPDACTHYFFGWSPVVRIGAFMLYLVQFLLFAALLVLVYFAHYQSQLESRTAATAVAWLFVFFQIILLILAGFSFVVMAVEAIQCIRPTAKNPAVWCSRETKVPVVVLVVSAVYYGLAVVVVIATAVVTWRVRRAGSTGVVRAVVVAEDELPLQGGESPAPRAPVASVALEVRPMIQRLLAAAVDEPAPARRQARVIRLPRD